jgi:hypothetical protein
MKALMVGLVLIAVALGASGCASGRQGKSVAPIPGTVPSTPTDVAIARVQASNLGKGFGFFPNSQARAGCRIPGPGLSLHIKGTCQTQVTLKSGQPTVVTFTEFWPARKFRTGGPPQGTLHHAWRFQVRTNGRVILVGGNGDFPPQMAE